MVRQELLAHAYLSVIRQRNREKRVGLQSG